MRGLAVVLMLGACTVSTGGSAQPAETPTTTRDAHEVISWNSGCPAVDAIYQLDGAPGFTAGFRATPEGYQSARDHLFWVHSAATDQTYWFGFSISTGYGGVFAIPQAGPEILDNPADGPGEVIEAGISLYPMGFDGVVGYEPPQDARSDAPPLIFAPELGPRLAYSVEAYGGTVREDMPRALFRLVRCGDEPVVWGTGQRLSPQPPQTD